ncbi:hypothetical protein [Flexithrix dorotheae]|uniref:hypothetical protein n=1 Tax=Flexithrix dorotheae TaxID=70993 RepID=UPI0003613EDD|nr:hypothetical protein [Flexithrix dorotheae]
MKKLYILPLLFTVLFCQYALGQKKLGLQPEIQNYRVPGFDGLNVFEDPKEDDIEFEGLKVRIGGDFAMQFQGLNHSTGSTSDTLVNLGTNFNLPTANLNIDVQLADGVRMHLRTYLSSRHHSEAWVKGGHISIDKLDFIQEDFLSELMEMVTVKIGLDEINYGDVHFRRSDNARAIYNPFVGNYIMDAFSTEAFGEVYLRKNGWLGMLAISNGKLNQSVITDPNADSKLSFYGKLGYDNDMSEDLRLRVTGSWYINNSDTRKYIYAGDRAGSRYYHVMETVDSGGDDFSGRFNPGFNQLTSFQINPFVKYKGLEFFGVFESATSGSDEGGSYTQLGAELLYRFGSWEQLYVGGRYNSVSGNDTDNGPDKNISRLNIGGGWFLTKNIVAKLEYVNQSYSGDGWNGAVFQDGEFDGLMIEAVIGF